MNPRGKVTTGGCFVFVFFLSFGGQCSLLLVERGQWEQILRMPNAGESLEHWTKWRFEVVVVVVVVVCFYIRS